MKIRLLLAWSFTLFYSQLCFGQASALGKILNDTRTHKIRINDAEGNLSLLIDYANGCRISEMKIGGKNVLSTQGVYTGFSIEEKHSSLSSAGIKVQQTDNTILLDNINYSGEGLGITERWKFSLKGKQVHWEIIRSYDKSGSIDESCFPVWNFKAMDTWKGGIIDNGGMVWCKYLANINDTYGVHTAGVTFWNPESGHALKIAAKTSGKFSLSSKFSHSNQHEFTFTQVLTDSVVGQRYNLSRFVSGKSDVFAPLTVSKGTISLNLVLEYIDYNKVYSRGTLPGIDAVAVRELLNTTGRYGVVDNNIIGANGWLTNWKCLHEPFFAQIGMALE